MSASEGSRPRWGWLCMITIRAPINSAKKAGAAGNQVRASVSDFGTLRFCGKLLCRGNLRDIDCARAAAVLGPNPYEK